MKTLPLRQLLRDPKKVKKLTLSGVTVRITDGGQPLWDIRPSSVEDSPGDAEEEARRHALWDEHFAELNAAPLADTAMPSMAEVMKLSRGDGR